MFQIEKTEPEIGVPTAEGVVTVPWADLRRLREQVTELQRRGTELVEENRRLRAELNDVRMAANYYQQQGSLR